MEINVKGGPTNEKDQEKNSNSNVIHNCVGNVDKLNNLRHHDSNNIKLRKEMKEMFIRKTLHNKIVRAKEREITELKEEIKELKDVRLLEVRNNTKILEQSDKKTELIKKITELLEINKYNNEKAIIDKIKELVRDYQSKN